MTWKVTDIIWQMDKKTLISVNVSVNVSWQLLLEAVYINQGVKIGIFIYLAIFVIIEFLVCCHLENMYFVELSIDRIRSSYRS